MNIAKMMKQAQQMQGKMQEIQAELAEREVEASAGGGKVTVTATCSGEVRSIKIAPEIVDPEDVEILEDLVLSGVKQAIDEGRKVMEEEMGKVTGGLGQMPAGLF
ncbi:MAG: YbaB/EbfC family nucleoid-associated protein [Verrucomicrobiaceae bacterium]|nr:YbaB/EbfC family nucleoid-associated protein [Verrucomicrobiaceae bacterium]